MLEKSDNQPKIAKLAQQEDSDDEDEDSNPICGPAETISGIIVGEVRVKLFFAQLCAMNWKLNTFLCVVNFRTQQKNPIKSSKES